MKLKIEAKAEKVVNVVSIKVPDKFKYSIPVIKIILRPGP
jgi:hypothetical protein